MNTPISEMEAAFWCVSERITRTTVVEFLCPHCHLANEFPDTIGDYVGCQHCCRWVILRGRFKAAGAAEGAK